MQLVMITPYYRCVRFWSAASSVFEAGVWAVTWVVVALELVCVGSALQFSATMQLSGRSTQLCARSPAIGWACGTRVASRPAGDDAHAYHTIHGSSWPIHPSRRADRPCHAAASSSGVDGVPSSCGRALSPSRRPEPPRAASTTVSVKEVAPSAASADSKATGTGTQQVSSGSLEERRASTGFVGPLGREAVELEEARFFSNAREWDHPSDPPLASTSKGETIKSPAYIFSNAAGSPAAAFSNPFVDSETGDPTWLAWTALGLMAMAYADWACNCFAIPTMLPDISAQLGFDDVQGSLLTTGYTYIFAASMIPVSSSGTGEKQGGVLCIPQ